MTSAPTAVEPAQLADQAGDGVQQQLVFVGQLFLFQPGQAVQAHFQDFLGLHFGQAIAVLVLVQAEGFEGLQLGHDHSRRGV